MKALPISKAKTAYGLVSDVIRAIREEPKRVNMTFVRRRVSRRDGGPACGTVGCVYGWCGVLGRDTVELKRTGVRSWWRDSKIFGKGLDYYTAGDNGGVFVFNDGSGDACGRTSPGTEAHADAVIRRITKFQRINAKALKAFKLTRKP